MTGKAGNGHQVDRQNGVKPDGTGQRRNLHSALWPTVKFAGCVAGIYASYLTQGYVSEGLSKRRYGRAGQRFEHLEALIGFQCIVAFLWAGLLWLMLEARTSRKFPPAWRYAWMGATNVVGPSCGMVALKSISYPAQVLAKSCKSVPIMVAGAILYGKRYKAMEYASACAIGLGVGLFAILSSSKASKGALHDAHPLWGYGLIMVNLAFDSMTNTSQDELNRVYTENSALHMMTWTNFWGGLYYMLYFFGVTSMGREVLSFCFEHRDAGVHVLLFCCCGAVGQLFIFFTISSFGSLVCSIICTTRKFFSILVSVLLAGSVLMPGQWGAVALVFLGLLYKSVIRLMPRRAKRD